MLELIRTNSKNTDFINLVKDLDADLKIRDGDDHDFYNQFNKIENLNNCIVAYKNAIPIGCGAIKHFEDSVMEIKRMYTIPSERGYGYASKILIELEKWAKQLSYKKCILETGIKQPEAIKLYEKNNYTIMKNYGPYIGVENSKCFFKNLSS